MLEIAFLITSIAALVTAVGGFALSFANSKRVLVEIKRLEHNTNSIKDELVAEVRKASFAAGKLDEKDRSTDDA
jgi:uncharacterized membrane protein